MLSVSPSAAREYSGYEKASLRLGLERIGGELEPNAEGKRIESIEIVTLDVIEPFDPAPAIANWFHVTTRHSVVRREILLREGGRFTRAQADETALNLQAFQQLSVVLVEAIKGSQPGTVRVLVVTKDIWSIRLGTDGSLVNGALQTFQLAPTETNLFGQAQTIGALISFNPVNYTLGGFYTVPAIAGSNVRGSIRANAIFDCGSNRLDGSNGVFSYGKPLRNTLTKWSWQVAARWSNVVNRPNTVFRGAICSDGDPLVRQVASDAPPVEYFTGENTLNGELVGIGRDEFLEDLQRPQAERRFPNTQLNSTERRISYPFESRAQRYEGQLVWTRSLFRRNKLDISFGVEADQRINAPLDTVASSASLGSLSEFSNGVSLGFPVATGSLTAGERGLARRALAESLTPNDTRISPYVQLHAYSNPIHLLLNYNTLGLQEAVRVGHNIYLRLFPFFKPLSTRTGLGVFASASYTLPVRDGFSKIVGSANLRYVPEDVPEVLPLETNSASDAAFFGAFHFVSPSLGLGRFVTDVRFNVAPKRFFPRFTTIGTDTRLRGFRTASYFGFHRLAVSQEFRTVPIQIFSVNFGLVAFYDAGDAFRDFRVNRDPALAFREFNWNHGFGVGLRVLAPQVDRNVFRLDFGFPVNRDSPNAEFSFFANFRQSFTEPFAPPPALLPQ